MESKTISLYPLNSKIPITKPKDIEKAVRSIVEDPDKLQGCNHLAQQVRIKRRRNSMIKNIPVLMNKVEAVKPSVKYKKVMFMREKIESDTITKKFLVSNKQHLLLLYVLHLIKIEQNSRR